MFLAENYTIEIRYGDFGVDGDSDFCFRASVKEFDNLEEYGITAKGAYGLIIDSITETMMHLSENDKEIPNPLPY